MACGGHGLTQTTYMVTHILIIYFVGFPLYKSRYNPQNGKMAQTALSPDKPGMADWGSCGSREEFCRQAEARPLPPD
jgi:hypothetical protein